MQNIRELVCIERQLHIINESALFSRLFLKDHPCKTEPRSIASDDDTTALV